MPYRKRGFPTYLKVKYRKVRYLYASVNTTYLSRESSLKISAHAFKKAPSEASTFDLTMSIQAIIRVSGQTSTVE